MQVILIVSLSAFFLLFLSLAVVILPAVLSFRPFDYHRVGYRAGVLIILATTFMVLAAWSDGRQLSDLRLTVVLELFLLLLVALPLGALLAYVIYRGLRSQSDTYAQREAILAERRQRERDGEPDRTRA